MVCVTKNTIKILSNTNNYANICIFKALLLFFLTTLP